MQRKTNLIVEISMKNPENYPIQCFAQIQNINSTNVIIVGALAGF
jgi:hypothetical protein